MLMISTSVIFAKGLESEESSEFIKDYKLFLIEVENVEEYTRIEPFVEVIIGVDSNI